MSLPSWTPSEDDTLRGLWRDGHSTAEIGRRMGRTKNSIIGRAHRLDLPPRGSPIITNKTDISQIAKAKTLRGHGASIGHIVRATGMGKNTIYRILGRDPIVRPKPAPKPKPAVVKLVVVASLPPVVAQKPLPVSLVPVMRDTAAPSRGGCYYPLWADNERPKFRDDGRPLLCDAPIERGSYCPQHAAVCYSRHYRQAEAA